MSKGNHRFRECELTRAIRAAQKANVGACVARITPTGSIEIEIADTGKTAVADVDRELRDFEARNGKA
jgi:hypothetical protein